MKKSCLVCQAMLPSSGPRAFQNDTAWHQRAAPTNEHDSTRFSRSLDFCGFALRQFHLMSDCVWTVLLYILMNHISCNWTRRQHSSRTLVDKCTFLLNSVGISTKKARARLHNNKTFLLLQGDKNVRLGKFYFFPEGRSFHRKDYGNRHTNPYRV